MEPDPDLVRIERSIGEILRIASSRGLHAARLRATGLDITRTEFRFLSRLDELGPISVSELASRLDVSQPTASRTLRRLEDAQLVSRQSHESDGRVIVYAIAAKGRRVRRRMMEFMYSQLAGALGPMPDARRAMLADLLDELVVTLHDAGRVRT